MRWAGQHVNLPCVTCGACCCTACRERRQTLPWRAPVRGGYHGCSPIARRDFPLPPTAPGSAS